MREVKNEVVTEWFGSQGGFSEDIMRRELHAKKHVRIFWARQQPRQRPGGGKEPEVVRSTGRSPQCLLWR